MGLSRRLLLLVVAVAALAVWLFVIDLPRERRQIEREADASVLMEFDPARADTLRVVRGDAPWKLARRGEDEWWLLTPIEERAEARFAQNALMQLSTFTSVRRLADDVSDDAWWRYGLSDDHPSRIDFVVDLEGGQRVVLHVGSVDPTGDFVYVRRGGSRALEVAYSELAELALSPHHGFRRPRVFDLEQDEIARMEIKGEHDSWTAERDAQTGLWWASIDGERERLRRWELDEIAYSITQLGVVQYLRDGLSGAQWSGYGLDAPWASIAWTSYDGREGRLDLGNETDQRRYFGRRSGLDSVFELLPGLENVLERSAGSFVDDNPLPRNVRRAHRIRIEDEDGTWVEQERTGPSGKDWIVTTDQGIVPASEYLFVSARNVALGLEEMQATATLMLARSQADDPAQWGRRGPRLRLSWPEGPDVEIVLHWRGEDSAPWLQVDDTPTLHRVDRGLFMRLRAMLDAAHAGR